MPQEIKLGLEKSHEDINKLNQELNKTLSSLLEIIKKGADIAKTFRGVSDLKGFSDFQNQTDKSTEAIIKAKKAYEKLKEEEKKRVEELLKLAQEQSKLNALQKEEAKQLNDLNKVKAKIAKANTKEALEYEKLNQQLLKNKKERRQEARDLARASSLYDRVDIKLRKTSEEYRDLAIKKELNGKLDKDELRRLPLLERRLQRYDTMLKKVDGITGKHTRNVGNYKSAYDGLGNSVSQIAREMPAFSNSIQTGFLAISNNLPIFFDEIARTKTEIKALRAEGKPTQSLFSKLAGSIFSLGTVLSIGVTLLTVYGKDLVLLAQKMLGTSDSAKLLKENMKKINEESASVAATTIPVFQSLVKASQDTTKSEKEREQAIKRLKDEYPDFNAQILLEKDNTLAVNKAVTAYISKLKDKAKAQAALSIIEEKYTELIRQQQKVEEERAKITQRDIFNSIKAQEEGSKISSRLSATQRAATQRVAAFNSEKEKEKKLQDEINDIMDVYVKNIELSTEVNKKQEDSIKKSAESRLRATQSLTEFRLEQQIKEQENIIKNEQTTKEELIQAIKDRAFLQMQLENSISDFAIKEGKLRGDALILQEEKTAAKLKQISEKSAQDLEDAGLFDFSEFETDDPLAEAGIDSTDFLLNRMVEEGKGSIKELKLLYKTDRDAFLELAKEKEKSTKKLNEFQKKSLDEMIAGFDEAYGVDSSKFRALFDKKKNTTEDYVDAASEASIGLVNTLQKDYSVDLSNLDRKEQKALELAGDNENERQRIQDEFAEKRRDIQRKQAKQDRDLAIFNILLNTARGVTAALTSTPPNVPLSGIIGALGAAQLIKVKATKLPEFKDGVRGFSGGDAIVGDGGVNEFVETSQGVFKTPNTPTITSLPKGSNVYKNEQDFLKESKFMDNLRSITSLNGILFNKQVLSLANLKPSVSVDNGGISKRDMEDVMRKFVGNRSTNNIMFDERGIKKWVARGSSSTTILNNYVEFKGKDV